MIFKRAMAKLRAQDWVAISIELVIVTVGVLIALAAQQWANDRVQRSQMDVSMKAVREELAEHYGYAVDTAWFIPVCGRRWTGSATGS